MDAEGGGTTGTPMRTTLVLGMVAVLAAALVGPATLASADHGPYCRDVSCCETYETGDDYVTCTGCVLSQNMWDTHGDKCIRL